jgi:hypothetical protein
MPVLKTQLETRKISLVTDPEAYVEVRLKQTYGDFLAIQKEMMGDGMSADELGKTQMKVDVSAFMISTLVNMIVGWNFTDESGVALPVTRENILLLDTKDASYVFTEITENGENGLGQDEETKKKEKNS